MTIHDDTRKTERDFDSTKSSCSEETAPSKPPKDVLNLGRYLVKELGLEEKVDTLGRWMAHYLAEQMDAVEKTSMAGERQQAQDRALETILKIWDHRRSLPRHTYPLEAFDDVLKLVGKLHPGRSPFRYASSAGNKGLDKHAVEVFDYLVRVVILFLLMRFPRLCRQVEVDDAAYACLDETERRALDSISEWSEMLRSREEDLDSSAEEEADALETRIRGIATATVDEAISALERLRAHLGVEAENRNI